MKQGAAATGTCIQVGAVMETRTGVRRPGSKPALQRLTV